MSGAAVVDLTAYRIEREQQRRRAQLPRPTFVYMDPWSGPLFMPATFWLVPTASSDSASSPHLRSERL